MKERIGLSALAVLALCEAALAAPGQIINLGAMGGSYSSGQAINNNGQAAGYAQGGGVTRAFRWSESEGIQDLGTLPDHAFAIGYAINSSGLVTGVSYTDSGNNQAFRWSETSGMQALGTLMGGGSYGYGINAIGQVTGSSDDRAYRWTEETGMQDLGFLPGGYGSIGYAINASGQVAGAAGIPGLDGYSHAFVWSESSGMRDLGTLGGSSSYGYAMNDNGQVAGFSYTASGRPHAFRWSNAGGMQDLGTLGGSVSAANAINAGGYIVGRSYVSGDGAMHATLWRADGSIVDLDAWLDTVNPAQGAPWTLSEAYGINDQGLITGIGYSQEAGGSRAFVLDASSLVPEPGTAGVLASGVLSLLSVRRRTTRR